MKGNYCDYLITLIGCCHHSSFFTYYDNISFFYLHCIIFSILFQFSEVSYRGRMTSTHTTLLQVSVCWFYCVALRVGLLLTSYIERKFSFGIHQLCIYWTKLTCYKRV